MAKTEFLESIITNARLPYGGVLYEMCRNGSAFDATLAEKMQLTGAAYNLSPLRDMLGKSQRQFEDFAVIAADCAEYKDALKALSEINLRFDCGEQDFASFREVIVTVKNLCESMNEELTLYSGSKQSIVQIFFWATFLHFHFPKAVFMCDNSAYRGACTLFSGNGTIFGEAPDGQFTGCISERYRLTAQGLNCQNLIEHCPENVQLERWLKYSISGYALCAYISENSENISLPLTVTADSVFRSVQCDK